MDIHEIHGKHLQEALEQVQRYLLAALSAAILCFLLSLGPHGERVKIDLLGVPEVDRSTAKLIAFAVAIVSGAMASWTVSRVKFLISKFGDKDKGLREAYLSYPSIATMKIGGPRWAAALLPAIFILLSELVRPAGHFSWEFFFGLFLCCTPFITLVMQLAKPLGGLPISGYGD